MRVIEHDPDRPTTSPAPEPGRLSFAPLRTIRLGTRRSLRIEIASSADRRSVALNLRQSTRSSEPRTSGPPIFLFPDQLSDVIAALTEAAAALVVP